MSEYQVKLEAAKEYEAALRFKRQYEELLEGFCGLIREFMNYCEKNGVPIPEKDAYLRMTRKGEALVLSRIPSADSLQEHELHRNRRGLDRTLEIGLNSGV